MIQTILLEVLEVAVVWTSKQCITSVICDFSCLLLLWIDILFLKLLLLYHFKTNTQITIVIVLLAWSLLDIFILFWLSRCVWKLRLIKIYYWNMCRFVKKIKLYLIALSFKSRHISEGCEILFYVRHTSVNRASCYTVSQTETLSFESVNWLKAKLEVWRGP